MGFKKMHKAFDDRKWYSITEEQALSALSQSYTRPEVLIDEMKEYPERTINLTFALIKYIEEEDDEPISDKEILDRIYDTIFENVGMSKYHVKFPAEKAVEQEIGSDIKFPMDGVRYRLTLERIEDDEETV